MNRQDLKANSDENTTFEFELKTEGVDVSNGVVSFVLIDDPFNYEFICKHVVDFRYSFVLPKKLKLTGKRSYVIRVVAEGFLFEPAGGDLSFITNSAVKTSSIKTEVEKSTQDESESESVITINSESTQSDVADKINLGSIDVESIISQAKNKRAGAVKPVQSSLDQVKPVSFEPIIPKDVAAERIRGILDEEKRKHEQQEAERRESARRELAERQQEIIRQTQEKQEKQSKIKEITKEFL